MKKIATTITLAIVLGTPFGLTQGGVTHAASTRTTSSNSSALKNTSCHKGQYKHDKCKVGEKGKDVDNDVPSGKKGQRITLPDQKGHGTELFLGHVANLCSGKAGKGTAVRVTALDHKTGKAYKKFNPPASLSGGTLYYYDPSSGKCSKVKNISKPGVYTVSP